MKVNGRLRTCDRCGKMAFAKHIGDGEADGGWSRWNKFESLEGWCWEKDIGDLCPECTKEWERMKESFKQKEGEEK